VPSPWSGKAGGRNHGKRAARGLGLCSQWGPGGGFTGASPLEADELLAINKVSFHKFFYQMWTIYQIEL